MDKKFLIVYHKEDNDGVCSCSIAMRYLVKEGLVKKEDIVLFGTNYDGLKEVQKNDYYFIANDGKEYNMLEDFSGLVMTDVSFNDFDAIEVIYNTYGSNFTWIDHHLPIIKESIKRKYDTKINGVRDHTRSALLNAYKYFYDPLDIEYVNGNAPMVLRVLSAWDSYTFEREGIDFEYARAVNMGFTKWYELNVEFWYGNILNFITGSKEYNEGYLKSAYEIGIKEVEEYDKANEKIINDYGMPGFTVDGRPAILLFMASGTSSLIFKSVKNKYKNGICAKTSPNGNILISLYNTDNSDHAFHCGEYLHKQYGGGGHEGAAGCTISIEAFNKILKEKSL